MHGGVCKRASKDTKCRCCCRQESQQELTMQCNRAVEQNSLEGCMRWRVTRVRRRQKGSAAMQQVVVEVLVAGVGGGGVFPSSPTPG